MSVEPRVLARWPSPPAQVAVVPRRRLPLLHLLLFLVTALTTTVAGALWQGIEPTRPKLLLHGVPFAATLLAILGTHEAGHYLMCRRHRVDATLPYFLPAPPYLFPLGTFGAFIRIRSRFPDRRALFDIGAAGPWAGFFVALAATVVGLRHSTVLPTAPHGAVLELGDSLLTAFLARLVLHADPANVVLHPVAFAGWFGLFVTSVNLLPVGQLDGGHVLYAAVGQRTRALPALLIACLVWLGLRGWPGWLVWGAITLFMAGLGHPPTRDDGRPLGAWRGGAALLSLVLFALTFVAEPFKILP